MKNLLIRLKDKKIFTWTMALFPLSVFYCEILFRASTVQVFSLINIVYTFIFSVSYGLIYYLISTLFNKKANTVIAAVLLSLTSVVYIVEYFVYKYFKIFYDIKTVAGGAGDMVGGFTGEMFSLIFAPGGIVKIILFFVPAIVFVAFGHRLMPANTADAGKRISALLMAAAAFAAGAALIASNSVYAPIYKDEYNFQSAVGNFGLMTGIRLDLKNYMFGDSGGFEQLDSPPLGTTASNEGDAEKTTENGSDTEETTSSAQPVEYGFNEMELDFSKPASDEITQLNEYVSSLTPSKKNKYTGLFQGKNLIMISAEAFSKEVIDEELTPTLYRLATKGINFTDYYQPASAGTTGGEYQNIFAMMPTDGGMSFKNTADNLNYFTMGSQLDRLGYYGKAFHNNTYTYYDRDKTHVNLGYSDGYMGYGNGMEEFVTKRWPQSDLEMIEGTLPTYIDKQPFNIYYMSVSGHSGYSRTGNSMTAKNWSRVEHLPYSDDVKGYLAANLELEDAMAHLVSRLEAEGIADDTVICISTDHFPYGLDEDGKLGDMPNLSELYGFEVTNLFERDHSALILWSGCLEDDEPIIIDTPTFSLDIVPTLSNLFGTQFDSRLFVGRDVLSDAPAIVFNSNYDWKTELGTYFTSSGEFVPYDENVQLPENYVASIKSIVRNKMRYCAGVLTNDYFRYLFG